MIGQRATWNINGGDLLCSLRTTLQSLWLWPLITPTEERERDEWMKIYREYVGRWRETDFKNENSERLSHLTPVPRRSVVLMMNAQSPLRSQHVEQQLDGGIEDKSSGRLTVESCPFPFMLKPYLSKLSNKSPNTCKKLKSDLH